MSDILNSEIHNEIIAPVYSNVIRVNNAFA